MDLGINMTDERILEHYDIWHSKDYNTSDLFDVDEIQKRLKIGSPQLLEVYNRVESGSDVLDIGCGNGSLLYLLKTTKKCNVIGIDFTDSQIVVAERRGIKVIKADVEQDNIALGEFDYVLCTELIEHLFDPVRFLKSIRKLLKKDGILILTTPNIAFIKNRINLVLGRHPTNEKEYARRCHHIHLMTQGELSNYLDIAGYKVIYQAGHAHFRNERLSVLNNYINKIASNKPAVFSASIITGAKVECNY